MSAVPSSPAALRHASSSGSSTSSRRAVPRPLSSSAGRRVVARGTRLSALPLGWRAIGTTARPGTAWSSRRVAPPVPACPTSSHAAEGVVERADGDIEADTGGVRGEAHGHGHGFGERQGAGDGACREVDGESCRSARDPERRERDVARHHSTDERPDGRRHRLRGGRDGRAQGRRRVVEQTIEPAGVEPVVAHQTDRREQTGEVRVGAQSCHHLTEQDAHLGRSTGRVAGHDPHFPVCRVRPCLVQGRSPCARPFRRGARAR